MSRESAKELYCDVKKVRLSTEEVQKGEYPIEHVNEKIDRVKKVPFKP